MSYQKYREMIYGKEAAALPEDVSTKDFSYKGPNNDWYGTIYILSGVPVEMAFYTWSVSNDNITKGFEEQMAEFEGEWEMFDLSGGQGHYTACLRRKEQNMQLTIEEVEKAIDWPIEKWEGNCYGVACQIVEKGLVEGEAVYGHFLGGASEDGYWAARSEHPFIRHGWILLPDGRIMDPTRWSFEAKEPYIWIGENSGEYDRGGNKLLGMIAQRNPWPDFDEDAEKTYEFEWMEEVVMDLEDVGAHLRDPLDPDIMERDPLDFEPYHLTLTAEQVFWIANLPLDVYKTKQSAYDVFIQIKEQQLDGFIPIDNRNEILGD
jgi:hypothetical protein